MKHILILLLCLSASLFSLEEESFSCPLPKKRQPNWKMRVLNTHEDGKPHAVLFYEPIPNSKWDRPVKVSVFNSDSTLHSETDLDVVPSEHPSTKQCGTTVLPHGASLTYSEDGKIKELHFYQCGLLHGPSKTFYPSMNLKSIQNYRQGILDGDSELYYDNGLCLERGQYVNGNKSGRWESYYPNGNLFRQSEYKNGLLHGTVVEREEKGKIKLERSFYLGRPRSLRKQDKKAVSQGQQGPIVERDGEGHKLTEYTLKDGIYDGDFRCWHANGQLKAHYYYKDGELEGLQQEFSEKGKLVRSIKYANGTRQGPFQEWHDNGQQKLSIQYVDGKKEGWHREWDDNGVLRVEKKYANGLNDGLMQEWFGDKTLQYKVTYIAGKKHGSEERNYSNGQKAFKAQYQMGLLNGDAMSWYEDGALHQECHYRQGIPVGIHREFFPRRNDSPEIQVCSVTQYRDGKPDGEQLTYYDNGTKSASITYDGGILHGKKTRWNRSGDVEEAACYDRGNLEGPYRLVKANGGEVVSHYRGNQLNGSHQLFYPVNEKGEKVKALECNFVNGLLEGEVTEYNEQGKKLSVNHFHNGVKEGKSMFVNDEGKLQLVIEFHLGKPHGSMIAYFPNGAIERETHYQDGLKEGIEKVFFVNGQMRSLYQYNSGAKNGVCQEWNQNGVLLFEGHYKNGKREGVFSKFSDDGKLRVLSTYRDDRLMSKQKME